MAMWHARATAKAAGTPNLASRGMQTVLPVVLEVEERVEHVEPATQRATAAPSSHASQRHVVRDRRPGADRASPSTAPSQKCESQVARFRYR